MKASVRQQGSVTCVCGSSDPRDAPREYLSEHILEQQSLPAELFEQGFDLSVLELDDVLLALVDHGTFCRPVSAAHFKGQSSNS